MAGLQGRIYYSELATDRELPHKGPYSPIKAIRSVGSGSHRLSRWTRHQGVRKTVGTLGYQRLFRRGCARRRRWKDLGASSLVHMTGPWTHADNVSKANAVAALQPGRSVRGQGRWTLRLLGLLECDDGPARTPINCRLD